MALFRSVSYGPVCGSNSFIMPGVEIARMSFRSSLVDARQYSGTSHEIPRAPTVTGQLTLPTTYPAFAAASQRVGTFMSSLYQYQPLWFLPKGSKVVLAKMLCLAVQ